MSPIPFPSALSVWRAVLRPGHLLCLEQVQCPGRCWGLHPSPALLLHRCSVHGPFLKEGPGTDTLCCLNIPKCSATAVSCGRGSKALCTAPNTAGVMWALALRAARCGLAQNVAREGLGLQPGASSLWDSGTHILVLDGLRAWL